MAYSLHASEVECVGEDKAHPPYEFRCEVSAAIPDTKRKRRQFGLCVEVLHGAVSTSVRSIWRSSMSGIAGGEVKHSSRRRLS